MGSLSYKNSRTKLELFTLEKRWLLDDLISTFQYLGEQISTQADGDRTEGNRLDDRKKFFIWRVVEYWNGVLREAVNAPSLEAFSARLDGTFSTLV